MSGWIKLHRKMLDNPIVCKDGDHLAVWTYLLLNATHKEYPAVFGKEKIILKPGQLITGRIAISERLRVSESKIQRILSAFENEQQIEQQTGNKNRLITILSWSEYQHGEQQNEHEMNNKRTTSEQQVNTNKNVKKVRSKEEPIKICSEIVSMKEVEYQKLIELMTEPNLILYIERFEEWIVRQPEKEQKKRSPYMSIRNWYKRDIEKKSNGSSVVGRTGIAAYREDPPIRKMNEFLADEEAKKEKLLAEVRDMF